MKHDQLEESIPAYVARRLDTDAVRELELHLAVCESCQELVTCCEAIAAGSGPESDYADAADTMVKVAQNNLAAHELGVGRFYLKHDKHVAAIDRFRKVLTEYPDFPDKEAVYYALGRALLQTENQAEARIYLDKLVTDFPDGKYAEQARRALSQANGSVEIDLSQ